jgi:WD repeat and SOF domain-containing protein 1
MKISALSRSLDQHAPARKGDAAPQSHNLDPALHPFDKAREYTRALAAAKLERMHAKPFVAALDGHADGVYSLALDARRLGVAASGSGDGGECWMRARRSCRCNEGAHGWLALCTSRCCAGQVMPCA